MTMLEMPTVPGMDSGKQTLNKMYADSKKRAEEAIFSRALGAAMMSAGKERKRGSTSGDWRS